MSKDVEKLLKRISEDPSAEGLVELVKLLSDTPENRAKAREVCLSVLTANPQHTRGRLALAKLYYLDKMGEFCVRELVELKKYSKSPALQRLIDSFGDFAKPFLSSAPTDEQAADAAVPDDYNDIVAEIDLDAGFVDALEELENSQKKH